MHARSIMTALPTRIELATVSLSGFGHRALRDAADALSDQLPGDRALGDAADALADQLPGDRATLCMGHSSQHGDHMKAGQKIDTFLDL